MKNKNNIPKHWEMASLVDDLPFIKTGVQRYDGVKKYYSTGSIKEESLTEEGEYTFDNKPSRANRVGVKGDVLQARMKNTQKAIIINSNLEEQLFSTGFFQIRGIEGMLSSEYIYYYLTSKTFNQLKDDLSSGSTQSALNDDNAKKIYIPIAPYKEQLEIVFKLEELLSEIDNSIENLKKAQSQIKIYKMCVLKWAFEGRLTNNLYINGKLPKDWEKVNLSKVIEKPKYGTSKKCEYNIDGMGVLRIPNISDGFVDSRDLKFAKFDSSEKETFRLKEGDILTIRSNGSVELVGKCALITKKEEKYLFAGYLIRLRPISTKINSKYLIYQLNTIELRNQIEQKAKSTSGVNNINSEELSTLKINLAPIKEQNIIVEKIESSFSLADKMQETITENLLNAETLRQSILNQAYSGKLIELKAENENVKNLLQRIKKEKERIISEEKERVKKDRPIYIKYRKMIEYKEILEILASNKEPISSKKLWEKSIYYKDIDAFYANLKKLVDEGKIKEATRDGKETYIELI
jgi:type I restriction enzyme S subunit